MNNIFYIDSPYLKHHGIKGMKWGIRRYQNPDGTLTAAGRRRVRKAMQSRDVLMTTRDRKEAIKAEKNFRAITNKLYPAEMQELVERVEKDEAIRKMSQIEHDDKVLRGMQYTNEAIKIVGNAANSANSIVSIARGINDIRSGQIKIGLEQTKSAIDAEKYYKEQKRADRAENVQKLRDAMELNKSQAEYEAKQQEILEKKLKNLERMHKMTI